MNWPWETLGLNGPASLDEIRRAYAECLRTTRPEDDPDGFQKLNQAYRQACRLARHGTTPDFSGKNTLPSALPDPPQEIPHSTNDDPHSRRISRFMLPQSPENMVWDYERLFAEGEAEERGLRFARALELRRDNQKRYSEWGRSRVLSGRTAMDDWRSASETLRVIETLYAMDAAVPLWREFLHGNAFLAARDNPDFVFGLEAFLREHPDFPASVQKMFFSAFAFRKRRRFRRRYRPLYDLLRGVPDKGQKHSVRKRLREWVTSFGKLPFALVLVVLTAGLFFTAGMLRQALAQTRLTAELSDFAAEWGYTLSVGRTDRLIPGENVPSGEAWEVPRTAYFLEMPLTGAGDAIDALGELFDALEGENFSREILPDTGAFARKWKYVLYLCWEDWCFYAASGSFDAQAARSYYEQRFGADMCGLIAERTGVARRDMGSDHYVLFSIPAGKGTEYSGELFFHAVAVSTAPAPSVRDAPLVHYLLSGDAHTLFCIPAEQFRQGVNPETFFAAVPETHTAEGFPYDITVYRLPVHPPAV